MSFDGVVDNFAAGIFVRLRPDGEAKFSASSQDAKCFRARFLRSRKMEQPEIHQNTVEARVRERQLLRVAFDEINFRETFRSRSRSFFSRNRYRSRWRRAAWLQRRRSQARTPRLRSTSP